VCPLDGVLDIPGISTGRGKDYANATARFKSSFSFPPRVEKWHGFPAARSKRNCQLIIASDACPSTSITSHGWTNLALVHRLAIQSSFGFFALSPTSRATQELSSHGRQCSFVFLRFAIVAIIAPFLGPCVPGLKFSSFNNRHHFRMPAVESQTSHPNLRGGRLLKLRPEL
jgi:hypothetical protein